MYIPLTAALITVAREVGLTRLIAVIHTPQSTPVGSGALGIHYVYIVIISVHIWALDATLPCVLHL